MNIWTPPADYKFPESKGRKFLYNWLRIFPNLCYSKYLDGAFCLSCVLFGRNSITKSSLKNLYTAPLTIWGSARGKLNSHFDLGKNGLCKCYMHRDALCVLANFVNTFSRRQDAINIQLIQNRKEAVRKNRESLKPIVETVIFLGRQNLPFRGHRDDSKYHANIGEQSVGSVGLFQSLINFRVSSGDEMLEQHLSTAARNAKYTSAPVQDELIEACGNIITKKIVK